MSATIRGIIRFVQEGGKILAVVDPFDVNTSQEAAAFYEAVLLACIKEMSRRGLGENIPLSRFEDLLPDQNI